MMSKFSILKDEITNDPLSRGYSGMTSQQKADDLNTKYRTKDRMIPSHDLLKWSGSGQRLKKLRDNKGHIDSDVANVVDVALLLVDSGNSSTRFDPDDSEHIAMLDTLVTAGVFSQEDKDSLLATGKLQISRGTELGIGEVHAGDIDYVMSL